MKVINVVAVILIVCILFTVFLLLKRQIKETLSQNDPLLLYLKFILKPLHPCVENLKLYVAEKSYTINKDKIYLCLKDKNGEYYPINQMVYVLIHEIAHLINTKDVGHTEEFHRVFEELLAKATVMGVYNPNIPIIVDYSN